MCQVRSSTFPKNNEMLQLQVVESNIELSSPSGSPITFNLTALNEKNSTLASTSLQKVGTFFQKSSALCGFRSSRGQRDKRKGA